MGCGIIGLNNIRAGRKFPTRQIEVHGIYHGRSGTGDKCIQSISKIVIARLASMAPGAVLVRAAQGGVLRVFTAFGKTHGLPGGKPFINLNLTSFVTSRSRVRAGILISDGYGKPAVIPSEQNNKSRKNEKVSFQAYQNRRYCPVRWV